MRELLILLGLAAAPMAWAENAISNSTCEDRLIEASARFHRVHERIEQARPGQLLPFHSKAAVSGLERLTQAQVITPEAFLANETLSAEFPGVRHYLQALAQSHPATSHSFQDGVRYFTVTVGPAELKALLARGVLTVANDRHFPMRPVKSGKPVTASEGQVTLVFDLNARKLAPDLPLWSLRGIVAHDLFHEALLETGAVLGEANARLLVRTLWSLNDATEPSKRPMVFREMIHPLSAFSLETPPGDDEIAKTDWDQVADYSVFQEAHFESFSFWLPFAKSWFTISDENGATISGQLFFFGEHGARGDLHIGLREFGGAEHYINMLDLKKIELLRYIPNDRQDSSRVPLSDAELYRIDADAAMLARPAGPRRLLILQPGGL